MLEQIASVPAGQVGVQAGDRGNGPPPSPGPGRAGVRPAADRRFLRPTTSEQARRAGITCLVQVEYTVQKIDLNER